MITITRKMTPHPLQNIETLPVLLFEGEANAHRFVIEPMDGINFSAYDVTARFIRPDQTNVAVAGTVDGCGNVNLVLTAGCYQAAGNYKLFIYVVNETETVCVYACTGPVMPTVGANGQAPEANTLIEAYTQDGGAVAKWLLSSHIYDITKSKEHGYNAFSDVECVISGKFESLFYARDSITFSWNGSAYVMDGGTTLSDDDLYDLHGIAIYAGGGAAYDTFTITRRDAQPAYQQTIKTLAGFHSLFDPMSLDVLMAESLLRHWWKSRTKTVTYKGLTISMTYNEVTINGTWQLSDYNQYELIDLSNDLALYQAHHGRLMIMGGHYYRLVTVPCYTSESSAQSSAGGGMAGMEPFRVELQQSNPSSYPDTLNEDSSSWLMQADVLEMGDEYTGFSQSSSDFKQAALCLRMPDLSFDTHQDAVYTFRNYKFRVFLSDVTGTGYKRGMTERVDVNAWFRLTQV